MKQEEVFRKIGGIIKELNDQYEYLGAVNGNMNDLELELFVSNAHFLTDHIEILRKLNLQSLNVQQTAEKPEAAERKYFEPVVQQIRHDVAPEEPAIPLKPVEIEITNFRPDEDIPVTEIDLSESSEETISPIKEEPETIRHELILDDSEIWDDDEYHETVVLDDPNDEGAEAPVVKAEPEIPVEEEIVEEVVIKHQEIKADEKTVELLTINQKISSQLGDKAPGRSEQLIGSPISDIKQAVTLNDKLLFVKDLFNGYSLAYTEAVEILNRFTTFEEATRFLNTNYVTKNNWESKPATADKFYALLKRRYA